MHRLVLPALALVLAASVPALANTCQTAKLTCATQMPVDGYCECTAHGVTEDGTVVTKAVGHHSSNATSGGCGTDPKAPGCR